MIPNIEILREYYITQNMSIREIARLFSCSFEPIQRRLRAHKIVKSKSTIRETRIINTRRTMLLRYGSENYMQSAKGYEQYKRKLLAHHGVTNIMQKTESKLKQAATCLKKYGVDHDLKAAVVKAKYRKTCIERYGVDNPFKSRKLMASALKNRKIRKSYISTGQEVDTKWGRIFLRSNYEIKFIKLLEQSSLVKNVSYETITIMVGDRTYTPDFLINNKIIIEIKPLRFIFPKSTDNNWVSNIAAKNREKHYTIIKWAYSNKYKYYLVTEKHINIKYISKILGQS